MKRTRRIGEERRMLQVYQQISRVQGRYFPIIFGPGLGAIPLEEGQSDKGNEEWPSY